MKHYIITKFTSWVEDKDSLLPRIREIFASVTKVNGIHGVDILSNCIPRDNRFDVMIVIDMDKAALDAYDNCDAHRIWKEEFGALIENKAIFDHE